jgi:tripartite ATP-independent transporter DctM subunit
MFDRLEKLCVTYTQPLAFVGVVGMLVAAGATVCDVLLRWLFNSPLPALNEVVSMLFAVAISATLPAGVANGVNLKIDLLARFMTKKVAAACNAIGDLLLLTFFALLTWQIEIYAHQLADQGRGTVMLGLPQAPFIYGASVLFAVTCLVQLVFTVSAIHKAIVLPGPQTDEEKHPIFSTLTVISALAVAGLLIWGLIDFPTVSSWSQSHVGLEVTYAFVVMWILMFGQVPLAAIMGLVGLGGAALLIGYTPALSAFATEAEGFLTNSQVATLPLFLMMGSFAAVADLASDLYDLAHTVLGRFRGGLALATVAGCAGFGALTSSSIATASLIGKVALPEMRSRGYSPALSTGCCAAGGTLGALVPPSGPLIVFALLTEASVGQLFIAAFGPAVLAVLMYFLTIWLYVRLSPRSAPAVSHMRAADLGRMLWRCRAVIALFLTVMGGLYLGVFTDTESAAVGAFGAFAIAALRGKLGGGAFWRVMGEVTAVTAMIYGIIFGAQTFSFYVAVSALTQSATAWVESLQWSNGWVILMLMVFYLLLGSLMESFAVMVITVPIVTPLILHMGYDIVWWGLIQLSVVETGLIHPPFGINVFVLKSMSPDIPIWTIYKGVLPFVAADLVKLALMVIFPWISLFLVHNMVTQ